MEVGVGGAGVRGIGCRASRLILCFFSGIVGDRRCRRGRCRGVAAAFGFGLDVIAFQRLQHTGGGSRRSIVVCTSGTPHLLSLT